ncbi:ArsR/SmtB family transcription factor [Paenibacillus cremeus]|uniref:Helix-turn-helix domain-containing protein n=1 Tax=Paenibacillus cremeus TaxID=2163881 RepID=A0A559KEK4_9BACL|nr:helix-turn-helix domain-containing protein [Paenibacillus cremeus]TVY10554.1 helix-turn-helix domain-containing protein [Paenibacillus cremeus]
MLKAGTDRSFLPLYEALASSVRLDILERIAVQPMSVKELAQALGLSSAIMTMHIRKLEQGGLVRSEMMRKDGGTHKMCSLAITGIEITLPTASIENRAYHDVSVPVGHYTAYEVYPTCGLATREKVIGQFDDPRYFLEPERMHAGILWFGKGYVEYKIPNYLLAGQRLTEIEITLEIGSEAPGVNEHYPSDIYFYLNGTRLGMWTSPGDYGDRRGRYTPDWWNAKVNQYGLLKRIRIRDDGTTMDGQRLSDVGLSELVLDRNHWNLRLEVPEHTANVGGLTLYGAGFGNYPQDIGFRVYYE